MSIIVDDPIYRAELEDAWKQLKDAYERAKAQRIYDVEGNEVQPALKQFVADTRRAVTRITIECEKEVIRQAQATATNSTAKIEDCTRELSEL